MNITKEELVKYLTQYDNTFHRDQPIDDNIKLEFAEYVVGEGPMHDPESPYYIKRNKEE